MFKPFAWLCLYRLVWKFVCVGVNVVFLWAGIVMPKILVLVSVVFRVMVVDYVRCGIVVRWGVYSLFSL